MKSYIVDQLATDENFTEEGYLAVNPDVAQAVREGKIESGKQHFDIFGQKEKRKCRVPGVIQDVKTRKLEKIRRILRTELPHRETKQNVDFLSAEFKHSFKIFDTEAVSSNNYDSNIMQLIEKYEKGILLDCGAGRRPVYFENVVNFEIVAYDTTDVLGVGEVLPFLDNSFDAVISIAVLEHVKDPFRCAQEIVRVLKPGDLCK